MKNLMELLETQFVAPEGLEFIECHEEVAMVEDCGMSGRYNGYHLYNVILENSEESYEILVKF